MEGNLAGLGSGRGSSGRRLPRAHVPEPRCARAPASGWREEGGQKEGEPWVGVAGGVCTPAQLRESR